MMVKELEEVVVRFSGDSGDGMQLAGNIFSNVSATVGNDICTFPDYPTLACPPASAAADARTERLRCIRSRSHPRERPAAQDRKSSRHSHCSGPLGQSRPGSSARGRSAFRERRGRP